MIEQIDSIVYSTRLKRLQRHVEHVWEAASILAENLILAGQMDLAHDLLANAHVHDASKFKGIEWLYLHDEVKDTDPVKFQMAFQQHVSTNLHHPESWNGGINEMPSVYVAEMVCDWKARSSEFGSSMRDWVIKSATEKYGFQMESEVGLEISRYIDMVLDKPFIRIEI